MIVIGLTGGIASGKSTVSQTLAELGAAVINADETGHELLKLGSKAWTDIVQAFGTGVIGDNGEIDRKKLGQAVFGDREALDRLNAITHPQIYSMVEGRLEELQRRGARVAVVEAALFIEADWFPLVDELWVTVAPEDVVIERLEKRNGMTPEDSKVRIDSQMPSSERIERADVIIDTDCSLEEVKEKVRRIWSERIAGRDEQQD